MAKFIVLHDVAILDRGPGEENRFVAIDGVEVDEYGALSPKSLQAAKKALWAEAVRKGATRIPESLCVDIDSGGVEASDDMIVAYNGGDIVYTSLHSGFAIEKFMIMNYLLLPATQFQVPRIALNGKYPAASADDVLERAEEIVRMIPSPTRAQARAVVDMILRESRIAWFSASAEDAVLRQLV